MVDTNPKVNVGLYSATIIMPAKQFISLKWDKARFATKMEVEIESE